MQDRDAEAQGYRGLGMQDRDAEAQRYRGLGMQDRDAEVWGYRLIRLLQSTNHLDMQHKHAFTCLCVHVL